MRVQASPPAQQQQVQEQQVLRRQQEQLAWVWAQEMLRAWAVRQLRLRAA
jgi:hypothetical protein